MVRLRGGLLPSSSHSLAARVCVFGPLLLVSACASNKQPSYVYGPGQQIAAQPRKVELEDDGQPVQPPPVRIMSPAEDDPSQPWSPNYGKGVVPVPPPERRPDPRLPSQVDAALPPAPIPVPLRVSATTTGTLTQISAADADAIISRAMSVHEMRRR